MAAILIIGGNEILIRSSPYSLVTSHKKLERSNNYHVNKALLNLKIKMAATKTDNANTLADPEHL